MTHKLLDATGKPIEVGSKVTHNGTVKEIRPAETEYHDDVQTAITKPPQISVEYDGDPHHLEYYTATTLTFFTDPVEYTFEELEVVST